MKVLHLGSGHMYGGIERTLVTLCRHRSTCPDLDPSVAFCFDARPATEVRETGVPVHILGRVQFSRPWTVWSARRALKRLLNQNTFDVAVCHAAWPYALFASVLRRARVPLVLWAHDTLSGTHWTEKRAAKMPPDLILVNSETTRRTVAPLFPGVPQPVLYYPVDASPAGANAGRAELRRSLDTSQDATVIVTACRLEPWKGHRLLLDGLGLLNHQADWVAWIVGGPQREHEEVYYAELKEQSARLGIADRVRFVGQRDDVPHLLAAADIHCQPNTGPEPFGVAFVEALYAGLPIVTTALGGPLEIVDESCGMLVAPDQPRALADALTDLIDHPEKRQRMGAAGPARAAALCEPRVALARLHELLGEAANARPSPLAAGGRLQPC